MKDKKYFAASTISESPLMYAYMRTVYDKINGIKPENVGKIAVVTVGSQSF
jgi:hypothetical protein